MHDPLGQAIYDFAIEQEKGKLLIHNTYGEPDEMPVEVYFREPDEFFETEQPVLDLCKGKVLDVGAGAGAHSLLLQKSGLEVDALELSELASKVMFMRGVKSIITGNVFDMPENHQYDTLLLMMNTIGLVGVLDKLPLLFDKLKKLLKSNGQILFDSSDVAYLYEGNLPKNKYHGEIDYQYEYAGEKGEWFKWLYVDFNKAREVALQAGLTLEHIYTNKETNQYLAKATIIQH